MGLAFNRRPADSPYRETVSQEVSTVDARRRPGGRSARLQPGVLVAIALGGALGASARYGLARAWPTAKNGFPWATFWTNLSGAFVLGLFLTFVTERLAPSRYPRPFFAIGVLGAYTTFSTMAVESVSLMKDGHADVGLLYLGVTLVCGLIAVYVGIIIGRRRPPSGLRRRAR